MRNVIEMKDAAKLEDLSGLCVTVITHREIRANMQLYAGARSLSDQLELVMSRPNLRGATTVGARRL